jgi:hypothetical protein
MKQAAAYTLKEDGEERFYTVLECGCTYPVAVETLFEADIPCPTHEEYRFTGDPPPPPEKPHIET